MTIFIEDISFKRVFFEITYRATQCERLSLFRVKTQTFVNFDNETSDDVIVARLNMTVAEERMPLEGGEWIICRQLKEDEATYQWAQENDRGVLDTARSRAWDQAHSKRKRKRLKAQGVSWRDYNASSTEIQNLIIEYPYTVHGIEYAPKVLDGFDDLSRVYRYKNGKYAIGASIVPRNDVTDYPMAILAMDFFKKNYHPRHQSPSLRVAEKVLFSAYHKICAGLSPKKGNRVLFLKENGEEPTPNMAAIRDRMLERGLDSQFVIKERYRNTYSGVHQNLLSWTSDIRAIAKADYIFIDDYCPVFNFIKPSKSTTLTQVWHAGVGFKSVGYARFGRAGSPDPYQSVHRRYTYALVGNQYLRRIYSEVFGIEEESLLATGMPRLDGFLDPKREKNAKSNLLPRFPWMEEGRVVVFAPTFRGASQRVANYPYDVYFDMDKLFAMCEATNTFFVFEMHHFIQERPKIPKKYASRIFDLSDEDLNELYFVADVLVTDYSSCFYDYLLLQKPVVFYVPDKHMYYATRGVQHTVNEMGPGIVCDTFDEFMHVLETSEYASVEPHPSMLDRCLENSGLASDRAIDTILLGKNVPGVKKE